MKPILFSLFFIITSYSFTQSLEPDEKAILDNHIKEYRMINRKIDTKESELDNRIMELKRFSKKGQLEYLYSFNVDIIFTKDSILYHYDTNGCLIEQVHYYIDFPIGKEQMQVVKDLDDIIDTSITIYKYHYNAQKQNIQVDEFEYGKLSMRRSITYDTLGRIIKEEQRHFSLPKDNDRLTIYQYDGQGRKVVEKSISLNDSRIIEEKKVFYDEKGNDIKELTSGKMNNHRCLFKYNEQGKILKTIQKGKNIFDGNVNVVIIFNYDAKGNLIERKTFRDKKLYDWDKYSYNDKNLISEEFWLDEKTGKVSTSILYEYDYFK